MLRQNLAEYFPVSSCNSALYNPNMLNRRGSVQLRRFKSRDLNRKKMAENETIENVPHCNNTTKPTGPTNSVIFTGKLVLKSHPRRQIARMQVLTKRIQSLLRGGT
jgi:hypothetical protein